MINKRIILLGYYGAGNLGNECTLQAMIERIVRRWPQASLRCACAGPGDVESRHNIPAFYWKPVSTPLPDSRQNGAAAGRHLPAALFGKLHRIPRELTHFATCLRLLWGTDVLIVGGGNLVSDYVTGPGGWPYDLFKWTALAALCRVKVLFLSIGVGPIYHPLSRWLIKRSLGFADYRSYRDEESKQYMERIGFSSEHDTVSPDLVFGLSRRLFRSDGDRAGQRPVIGVGLRDYYAPSIVGDTYTYQDYLGIMVTFVCWLCEHGYNVRLLTADFRNDMRMTEDVIDAIKGRFVERGQVVAEPALTVEELVHQLDKTDVVISPRFHNLVLALMLNKPVIALSDHPRLDSLMAGLNLAKYCLRLGDLNIDSLIKLFGQLQNDEESLKAYIRDKTEKYREALDQLYDLAFARAERPGSGTIAGVSGVSVK